MSTKYMHLPALLNQREIAQKNKTALIVLDQNGLEQDKITYGELMHSARSIASGLQQDHKKGDTCLLISQPGVEFFLGLLACFYSGLIAVPIQTPRKNKRNERFWSVYNNARPSCMLISEQERDYITKAEDIADRLASTPSILIDRFPKEAANPYSEPQLDGDDTALLQYTSGTTGDPQGTILTHASILHNSEVIKRSFAHDEHIVVVDWLPPYHDMGLIGTLLQPIYAGGSNVIMNPTDFLRNPVIWLEAITKYKGTTAGCPNFALDLLVERVREEQKDKIDLSTLTVFFCGSEPIHPGSMKGFEHAFYRCGFKEEMFLPCYGLAENTLMASGIHASESPVYLSIDRRPLATMGIISASANSDNALHLVGCGNTWLDDEIKIVDSDNGIPLPEGHVGEIWLKSGSSCSGYYHNKKGTEALFGSIRDNGNKHLLRTGDLGFIFNEQLFITGRIKELMKIRGKNHYPHDIENTIEDCHPALQSNASAVFQITAGHHEEVVILHEVKRTAIRDLDHTAVIECIRHAVTSEHEISVFAIALVSPGRIPRTSSGKIQRLRAKAMWLDDSLKTIYDWQKEKLEYNGIIPDQQGDELDEEHLQKWLISWLSKKLGIAPGRIDPRAPIMSYGLDSMGAVELEREVIEQFGIEIHLADFLENNTIADLARIGAEHMDRD